MKAAKPRMTLAQYLQSTNLRRKVQSLSKSKDKVKNICENLIQGEGKKSIDYMAFQQNRKIKTQFQKCVEQLKLVSREIIIKDTEYIKVLRLVQTLASIFQKQMEQFRKDNSFLKSYLLQGSFWNQLQLKNTIKKESNNQLCSTQKNANFIQNQEINQVSQEKQTYQQNLRVEALSECPRLSLMSKFDENRAKKNQISVPNQVKSKQKSLSKIQVQPPRINIKLVDRNKYECKDYIFRQSQTYQAIKDMKKYNPQHSTNQQSQKGFQNVIQSPAKKSVIWQQSLIDQKLLSVQKDQNFRQMLSLHTPSTFHKNSERLQNNLRKFQFSDRENSVSIRRYQHYKRNKNNEVNKITAFNSKTSIKQYK